MTYQAHLGAHDRKVQGAYGVRTAEYCCGYLLPHIKPTSTILDVGAGPATISCDFAAIANNGHVTGLDITAEIVEQAKAEAANRDPPLPNTTFVVGSANALPFPDNTFDIVHCHNLLVHLADPVGALVEFRRVSKSGGLVACRETDMSNYKFHPPSTGLDSFWAFAQRMQKMQGASPDAGRLLGGWTERAGFVKNCIEESTSESYLPGASDVANDDARAAPLLKARLITESDLHGWRKAWADWEACEDKSFMLMSYEVLCRKE